MFCTAHQIYNWEDKIENNEIGGACSSYGEEETCGNLKARDHLKDPAIDGSGMGSMGWIDLAQDRDRWRTLLNVVINPRVPLQVGNFLTS
jgi:hypothetical protein